MKGNPLNMAKKRTSKKQVDDGFQDISSYKSKQAYNMSGKPKKKKHTGLKVFLTILCVLFIAVGAGMLYVSNYLLAGLTTTEITRDKEELGIVSGTIEHENITNIALFGLDNYSGDYSGRPDSIMILSVDEIHGKIKLTSILRDSRVYIGEESAYSSGYDKINHAYVYGGPELTIKTINSNFGLNVQDYVTVNFHGLVNIIDAFGGVEIEITSSEASLINGMVGEIQGERLSDTSGGLVTLDGSQAVSYSRIRSIDGDDERANRQQTVLLALLDKATSISPLEYPDIINEVSNYCETSLGVSTIIGLTPILATDFSIEQFAVPTDLQNVSVGDGFFEGGGWMWDYDTMAAGEELNRFIYEDQYDILKETE